MNQSQKGKPPFLLALHSSTETFGVGFADYRDPFNIKEILTFPIGRKLSNKIFNCVDQVLPSKNWKHLVRIAVATGPGGFTGTRLSIVMARTLSQQIGCPLDGISSFQLMAPRLIKKLNLNPRINNFWIIKEVPRRGLIGGKYEIQKNYDKRDLEYIKEIEKPHLLNKDISNQTKINAIEDVSSDVNELLRICTERQKLNQESSWTNIFPIYPTSPVENIS